MIDNKIAEYINTQLEYDYKNDPIPTNTQAMVKISHDLIIKTVKEFAQKNIVHILDVGCGWGDFSNELDLYIKDYIGVDPSLIELKRFLERKKNNRFLIRGFGENLDYLKDNSRNLILLNSVLDHCYDWKKTLENCYRILSSNGYLIIAMENADKLPVRLKKLLSIHSEHHGHLSYFSGADLENHLKDNYKLLDKNTTGFLFGFHSLTKILPVPKRIMIALNKFADMIAKLIIPFSGHMLFYVFKSKKLNIGDNVLTPFRCPSCFTPLEFRLDKCSECNFVINYLDHAIMDGIDLAKKMNANIPL